MYEVTAKVTLTKTNPVEFLDLLVKGQTTLDHADTVYFVSGANTIATIKPVDGGLLVNDYESDTEYKIGKDGIPAKNVAVHSVVANKIADGGVVVTQVHRNVTWDKYVHVIADITIIPYQLTGDLPVELLNLLVVNTDSKDEISVIIASESLTVESNLAGVSNNTSWPLPLTRENQGLALLAIAKLSTI